MRRVSKKKSLLFNLITLLNLSWHFCSLRDDHDNQKVNTGMVSLCNVKDVKNWWLAGDVDSNAQPFFMKKNSFIMW